MWIISIFMFLIIIIFLLLLAHQIVKEIKFDNIIRSHLNQNKNNIETIQLEK